MALHGMTIEQKLSWERDGYLVVEGFLDAAQVDFYNERLDSAFQIWATKGGFNPSSGQLQNVQQVCNVIEYDDALLELMENARMMNILRDAIGDSFVMIDNDGLIKPPQKEAHTNWHRDTSTMLFMNEKKVPFMAKVFYFLSDVRHDGGCLAFLPGSVHMTNEQLPKVQKQEDMPAHVRMSVKAGTAVIFNGYTYHSALNNFTDETRRSLIYNYAPSFLRTWPGYEPSETLKAKADTRLRQMLLGMLPWTDDPKAFEEPAPVIIPGSVEA
ncbi:phytanoyl-CoA dioxygenase family protein [Paenibacillus sacheonensis]|nr:phytanoyl-CoA dioxygenase family protein [Paenibacillus sacheonensis]MBM7566864.1 ectoine hydroxylase-related dioxygenase (phytanoyl-CoA dioxygenase family) [Paenibacillus sacheonensis]